MAILTAKEKALQLANAFCDINIFEVTKGELQKGRIKAIRDAKICVLAIQDAIQDFPNNNRGYWNAVDTELDNLLKDINSR